jgi:hypothetical protein
MEMFGQSVVATDPFRVVAALRDTLAQGHTMDDIPPASGGGLRRGQ